MATLPRVALIITGGTIDSIGKDRLDLAWYIEAGKAAWRRRTFTAASRVQKHRAGRGNSLSSSTEPCPG